MDRGREKVSKGFAKQQTQNSFKCTVEVPFRLQMPQKVRIFGENHTSQRERAKVNALLLLLLLPRRWKREKRELI